MSTITYFDKPGPANTNETLALAAARTKELDLTTVRLCKNRGCKKRREKSGRRASNSQPSPWEGDTLPLSYSRLNATARAPKLRNGA